MFGRKEKPAPPPVLKPQRFSLERNGEVIAQLPAQRVEILYTLAGQWAPYKAHFSGKLVTAYRIETDNKVLTVAGDICINLKKGDMLYADNDFRAS